MIITGPSPLYKTDGDWSFVYSSKSGGWYIFLQKKGEVGKKVEEWRLLRENKLCFRVSLCVYKSKKHYNPRYIYIKVINVTGFNRYPNFLRFRNRHLKIFLHVSPWCPLLITDHIFGRKLSLIHCRQIFYQNLACGEQFQFNNHDLFEHFDWN